MGNNQSNPSSQSNRSSTISRSVSTRPRSAHPSASPPRSPSPPTVPRTAPPDVSAFEVQSESGAPPPPPYAMLDPEPREPPPVPPRDRPSHRRSNGQGSQDSAASRRMSSRLPTATAGAAASASGTSAAARNRTQSASGHGRSAAANHPRPPRVDWRTGRSPPQSQSPPRSSIFNSQDSRDGQSSLGSRNARLDFGADSVLGNPIRSESPPAASPRQSAPVIMPKRRSSVEDPLEYLRRYDTVIIVDDSTSMEGPLWYETRNALAGIAEVAARYDLDGIDVHFLNSALVGQGMRNGTEVKRLFDRITPYGITPTGEKLEELLLDYLLKLEEAKAAQLNGDAGAMKRIKPVNFLVITDGAATDDPESVIVQAARRLDEGHFPLSQVGIQFVQIGTDEDAAEALRVLDDDLATVHGVRDIVDTFPYTAEGSQLTADSLSKILLGGINRRLDRRKPSIG